MNVLSGHQAHHIAIIYLILVRRRLGGGIALGPGSPQRSHRITTRGDGWRLLLREINDRENGVKERSLGEDICALYGSKGHSFLRSRVS